jgi:hypothetical protein
MERYGVYEMLLVLKRNVIRTSAIVANAAILLPVVTVSHAQTSVNPRLSTIQVKESCQPKGIASSDPTTRAVDSAQVLKEIIAGRVQSSQSNRRHKTPANQIQHRDQLDIKRTYVL